MKMPERGTKGFTLIELLIVIAILGVLAAVVIPNVVGLMGRGGEQSYETDEENIQLATSTFYSDTHAGFNQANTSGYAQSADNRWGCQCTEAFTTLSGNGTQLTEDPGHYYPTSIGFPGLHQLELDTNQPDADNEQFEAFRVVDENGADATDAIISIHAIWMGLLYNEADADDGVFCDNNGGAATVEVACTGTHTTGAAVGDCDAGSWCGTSDRWYVAALRFEGALYIQEFPDSAMITHNGDPGMGSGGGYAWIVGDRGTVYGCYQAADNNWYAGFSGAYP
jgi:prepilin-type N-terminal cleavage/methylation domain-containing protein